MFMSFTIIAKNAWPETRHFQGHTLKQTHTLGAHIVPIDAPNSSYVEFHDGPIGYTFMEEILIL